MCMCVLHNPCHCYSWSSTNQTPQNWSHDCTLNRTMDSHSSVHVLAMTRSQRMLSIYKHEAWRCSPRAELLINASVLVYFSWYVCYCTVIKVIPASRWWTVSLISVHSLKGTGSTLVPSYSLLVKSSSRNFAIFRSYSVGKAIIPNEAHFPFEEC